MFFRGIVLAYLLIQQLNVVDINIKVVQILSILA